ncbi:hypothetical protein LCGC14_0544110 [marine sediment metagenome]|uniref:Uncharacterized protein n=1 Tax=marine sediment metagenome TaxID=412755 RepID=A0A0F9UDB5_9ZZZZ|nr:MAG: hypothetical protein Lokiarch_03420 [Candidatus Lokiarchaeum sp. GC14_75]
MGTQIHLSHFPFETSKEEIKENQILEIIIRGIIFETKQNLGRVSK